MAGVNILVDAVKVTLGPRGRNVIIECSFDPPILENSGVVVTKEVFISDPFENMGAQMVREVASRTSDVAGDGTTTATTVAQAIVREGMKHVTAGINPMDIKRDIDMAVDASICEIMRLAKPCSSSIEIAQVASISANSDVFVGKLIAEAMEMKERKGRVEDALHATRAAVEEGIIPGGGVALIRARHALDSLHGVNTDQDAGISIVRRALEKPLRQIVINAGVDPLVVVDKVIEGNPNFGHNAANETFGDMFELGMIDPVKVTRSALQNAASIAGLILTTDCMIAQVPKPAPPSASSMNSMMY